MTQAVIGLGANLGDPPAQIREAIDAIAALPGTRLVARSSLYRTAPMGFEGQPDFTNAAAAFETTLAPRDLLGRLKAIEDAAGRDRPFANAPRTLDLDILLYGEASVDEGDLVIPHPRLHERAFALAPLVEIAPDAVIPGRGRAATLLAGLGNQRIDKLAVRP